MGNIKLCLFITSLICTLLLPTSVLKPSRQKDSPTLANNFASDYELSVKSPLEADKIIESIEFINAYHEILNQERFGAVNRTSVSSVIVVQVHKRIEYLQYLINSLKDSRGIERALLVFSHDLNVESINRLIRNITFCRVIQIFYPYNIQIFPNTFPGRHPNDCPEKATKEEADALQCSNRKYPDKYGHYRIASLTQIKHHWWWKMNYVFDGIVSKYGLESYVVLLEEDHMVAPDFLHILQKLIDTKNTTCPDCHVLCLGAYLKSYSAYREDIAKVSVQIWYSSKHNMGMAINGEMWKALRNCSQMFCTYDDYNWDWSLLQMSVKCLSQNLRPLRVLLAKSPRVLHIGDCGVHTHRCAVHNAAAAATSLFQEHRTVFFPPEIRLTEVGKRMLKPSKPNGGWGDIRDHKLCLFNTYPIHEYNQSSTVIKNNLFRINKILDSDV
ncbi:n-acetylglucosaminyltransferase II (MGAT2) domain-containing protein [Ditylenchus destructor]|uniref:Alpha-1,6-mannosyl-glycoprotein 2-beta-N-acetylglucosaminyltransferase n=1 Tax=Ditylenchus destructor TaxID=166010 RepID=A0AAD4RC15_9BILA|nr:n-acetylglucosaminyltransferase II (MGAT2) domain-containing protein [Ditylenchus destructor]